MKYLALFDKDGHRETSIPCDATLTDARKEELLAEGYAEITEEDFAYYIGNRGKGKNDTGYIRGADGKPTDAPPIVKSLAEVKAEKLSKFKRRRDAEEVENITYDGHPYDYDQKSRERLHIARQALQDSGKGDAVIVWTTADNERVTLTVAGFAAINALAAQRSNTLHVKYNALKERVNAAETVEAVGDIKWVDKE